MIKIAICDDDGKIREEIKNKLATYTGVIPLSAQLHPFSNAEDLLEQKESFDIIFLDIQMTGMNGMEAAKRLRDGGSESFLVFVTILKEYVYDAFSVEASDYLLKPIDAARFTSCMDRIINYIQDRNRCLLIQKGSWCKSIPYADILYCEAISRKIFVHTKHEIIDYYYKIKELEQQLKPSFFCCHRSYLVNLQAVCGYENGLAKLNNGDSIPVSRLRQQEFMQAIMTYMQKGEQ